jgi:hypothetical protein
VSIRGWIINKLKDRYVLTLEGQHGLRVQRQGDPDAVVYCVEPSETVPFSVEDLDQALQEMPDAQFIVVIRRDVTHRAYERAEELGVCVDGFGELQSALGGDRNVATHHSRDVTYLRSRIERHRYVTEVWRRGKTAYEITRSGPLLPVVIVTIPHYELTSDGVYTILEEHDHLEVDAIVSTNPYARGFAREAVQAANRAGVEVLTLNDLLDRLGEAWD